MDKIDEIYAET